MLGSVARVTERERVEAHHTPEFLSHPFSQVIHHSMSSNCIIRKLVWKYSLIDAYPKNLMDGISEDFTDESTYSGDGEINAVSMGFGNKMDQDAFVFQRIMEALPPNKLLLMLGQGQTESTSDVASDSDSESESESDYESETNSLPADLDSERETSSPAKAPKMFVSEAPHPLPLAITTPSLNTRKSVRFALGKDGGVKADIRVFEKNGNELKLWWTKKEMTRIRKDCVIIVNRYRSRFPEYIASVSAILEMALSSEQDAVKEVQILVQQYDARGLEQHIVEHTGVFMKRHGEAVREEAQLLWEEGRLDGVGGSETLREQSLQTSRPCGLLAEKLAECDAIKCNAERWFPSQSTILEGSVGKDLAPPPQKSCCVIS